MQNSTNSENKNPQENFALVKNYRAPESAKNLVKNMRIALLIGIVAAGKDSILQILLQNKDFARIVTTISRAPRPTEIEGKNYYFIDDQQVQKNLLEKKYFEAKIVHGKIYGTTITELEKISRENKIALADVDVQGVAEFHAANPKIPAIFIVPPNFSTWLARWKNRDQNISRDNFLTRLISAKNELDFALSSDYFQFVINDDLAGAAQEVEKIIRGEQIENQYSAKKLAQNLRTDIVKMLEKI